MVAGFAKTLALVFALSIALTGCGNDLLGILAAPDFSRRWQARETFHFLTYEDRNLPLADDGTYSFIVVADTHGNTRGFEKLARVIDDDVKFVAVVGDITQTGSRAELEKFLGIARGFGVPVFPVIGNHDIYFGNWPVWEKLVGSTVYRVNIGVDTLLILDSANAFFGARQLDWLENELRNSWGRVFVFSHVSMFNRRILNVDARERARIVSMLKGNADAVFMGHTHGRDVATVGGVHYITIEDFRRHYTYLRVFVSRDSLRWEFGRL